MVFIELQSLCCDFVGGGGGGHVNSVLDLGGGHINSGRACPPFSGPPPQHFSGTACIKYITVFYLLMLGFLF